MTNEHTGEEYLGKDRDELRAIIVERDIEIERLQKRNKDLMDVIDSRDRALGFVPLGDESEKPK